MKNRFTEEQIVGVLKEAEICRKHGISVASLKRLRSLRNTPEEWNTTYRHSYDDGAHIVRLIRVHASAFHESSLILHI